jgi:hypothetical protein
MLHVACMSRIFGSEQGGFDARLRAVSSPSGDGPLGCNQRSLLLRGVDGRSVIARRYRDVAIALADNLGGQDKLSEPRKILIRQASALTVQVEGLQSKIVSGHDVDLEQLTRLSNGLGRTLSRLGVRKRADRKLSVPEFLPQRDVQRAGC